MIAPVAQGSKNGEFAGIRQATTLQGLDEFRTCTSQERVGGLFQRNGERDRRALFCEQAPRILHTAPDIRIGRLAGKRERQVVGGVFVRTINQGVAGQGCQALQ